MIRITSICLLFFFFAVGQRAWSQPSMTNQLMDTVQNPIALKQLRFHAYGVVNYYAFDWETLPDQRNAIDPERLNVYMLYDFTPTISFKAELEWEHGGTGSSLSFDPLEEFGEFEQELEKGGAVVLEQMNVLFKVHPAFQIRVGKMKMHMGLASRLDEPKEYFTSYRSEMENTLLPLGWYETGIEISGKLGGKYGTTFPFWDYKMYVVSGLDNTAFSSRNWIRPGYQGRFETLQADQLAVALRLDYVVSDQQWIGFGVYANNPTGNRPKNDFTLASWVGLGELHAQWDLYPFKCRLMGLYGQIQNSEALSAANRNLSNHLNVKRTPVAKSAAGASFEFAYDVFHLLSNKVKTNLYVFVRADWYDSMLETEGNIFNNPRYERRVFTAGLNYLIHPGIVIKSHMAWRTLGSGEKENTFGLGLGFNF